MLLLWENSPLGKKKRPRHIRDGMENAVGGGETPRLWGVSSKLWSLRVCSFCFVFQVASLAPGSAVLRVLLPCSLVCFIFCTLDFWLGKGCWKLWGPLNCLVFRQAVCDTYVNQVNKEKHHRFERANCGYSFLTSGFLAISEQVPSPEQESHAGGLWLCIIER